MKLILQLSLIVILWNHAAIQVHGEGCANIKNIDLQIPANSSILIGEKKNDNDSWYQHITWLDTFAGDLELRGIAESKSRTYWGDIRGTRVEWPLFREQNGYYNEIRKLVIKALGLNEFFRLPGKVRVPSNLFNRQECLYFSWLDNKPNTTYRLRLGVFDEEDNKILTGHLQLELPRQRRRY